MLTWEKREKGEKEREGEIIAPLLRNRPFSCLSRKSIVFGGVLLWNNDLLALQICAVKSNVAGKLAFATHVNWLNSPSSLTTQSLASFLGSNIIFSGAKHALPPSKILSSKKERRWYPTAKFIYQPEKGVSLSQKVYTPRSQTPFYRSKGAGASAVWKWTEAVKIYSDKWIHALFPFSPPFYCLQKKSKAQLFIGARKVRALGLKVQISGRTKIMFASKKSEKMDIS